MTAKTIACGWFLVGVMTVLLLQTQTEPRRKRSKTEDDKLAGKKLTPFPRIDENMKQAAGN